MTINTPKIICTAEQFRALRLRGRLTQQQLARLAGIGETSIQRYEHLGISKIDVMERIMKAITDAISAPEAHGVKPEPCPYEIWKPHGAKAHLKIPALIAYVPEGCKWYDWHGLAIMRAPIADDIAWLEHVSMKHLGLSLHWQLRYRASADGPAVDAWWPRPCLSDWGIAETKQNRGAAWQSPQEADAMARDALRRAEEYERKHGITSPRS